MQNMQKDRPLYQNVQNRNTPEAHTETTNKNKHTKQKHIKHKSKQQLSTKHQESKKHKTFYNREHITAGGIQSEENESVDPESTCYIREMIEYLSSVKLVNWKLSETKINTINKTHMGEYWLENETGQWKIYWLVDTGRQRSFVSQTTANWLTAKLGNKIQNKATKLGEFICFKNNKIQIDSTLNINLTSGNTSATNCEILVVPHNTVILLVRDILQKLGIHLSETKKSEKAMNLITTNNTHKIFIKFPHICT